MIEIEFEGHHIHEIDINGFCIKCNKSAEDLTFGKEHGNGEFGNV